MLQARIIGQNHSGPTLEAINPDDKTTVFNDSPTQAWLKADQQAILIAVATAAAVIGLLWYAFK